MEQPPRRVGKRLIGRFLLLRIAIATFALVAAVVGSVFWIRGMGDYTLGQERSQALNTLNFGACSVTLSARFSRKSALHKRSFQGNSLAGWSYLIMLVLQVFITYTPGLNTIVFSMEGMDGKQWGIAILMMVCVFIVMETEKCVRNYLSSLKYDVDDRDADAFWDDNAEADKTPLPEEVHRFGRNELPK
jgi:magnesium-transporting ATPase (P-type)